MNHSTRPALAALALAAFALGGCDTLFGPGTPDEITSLPRSLSTSEEELIRASNRFGFDLLGTLHEAEPEENLFVSPLSASMALGMALNGADGATFDAMRGTLGFPAEAELSEINESYRGLIDLLQGLDPRVEFLLANSVWLQRSWPFLPAYRERVGDAFAARVENVDFRDASTADAINAWVREGTGGRIEQFVVPRQVRDLVALLANTVYFKGNWRDRFDESDTSPGEFRLADGSTVSVPLMKQEMEEVRLGRGEGFRAADLAYGGKAFSMTVLLPDRDASLEAVVGGLDAEAWRALVEDFGSGEEVRVEMPRFELEYGKRLNRALIRMGMGVAFDPDSADLSRMAETPPCTAGTAVCLYIDWVKQKSFVQVDEEGTEATAATGVGMKATSAPPTFRVDRPFLFAIRERLSGTVLFVGKVVDPTAD